MGTKYSLAAAVVALSLVVGCVAPEESEEEDATYERDGTPRGAIVSGSSLGFIGEVPISDAIIPGDPAWPVEAWTRLPVTMPAPTLENLIGKVVVIFAFQHW